MISGSIEIEKLNRGKYRDTIILVYSFTLLHLYKWILLD